MSDAELGLACHGAGAAGDAVTYSQRQSLHARRNPYHRGVDVQRDTHAASVAYTTADDTVSCTTERHAERTAGSGLNQCRDQESSLKARLLRPQTLAQHGCRDKNHKLATTLRFPKGSWRCAASVSLEIRAGSRGGVIAIPDWQGCSPSYETLDRGCCLCCRASNFLSCRRDFGINQARPQSSGAVLSSVPGAWPDRIVDRASGHSSPPCFGLLLSDGAAA